MNPHDLLNILLETFFQGITKEDILCLSDDARTDFMYKQVDRLLSEEDDEGDLAAAVLAEKLWIPDEDGYPDHTPLALSMFEGYEYTPQLSAGEQEVFDFIYTTALLCSHLMSHNCLERFIFQNGKCAFVDKEQRKWYFQFMQTTEYERLAIYIAYALLREIQKDFARYPGYAPVVDYLAQNCIDPRGNLQQVTHTDDITPKEYIQNVVELLTNVHTHIEEGRKRGMDDLEIAIHDIFCGRFMTEYIDDICCMTRKIALFIDDYILLTDDEVEAWCDKTVTYGDYLSKHKSVTRTEAGKRVISQKGSLLVEYIRVLRNSVDKTVWEPYLMMSKEYLRYLAEEVATNSNVYLHIEPWI